MEKSNSTPVDSSGVDYFVMNFGLTGYVPVLEYSTLALNYFRTDAHVTRKGITDPEILKQDFGCFETSVELCESFVQEVVQDQVSQNTYGSTENLGGAPDCGRM